MLREIKLTYENLSAEIPVVIKNSSMTNVLLCELDSVQVDLPASQLYLPGSAVT